MKTIQTAARYFPEKCGGIQIRLSELLPMLQEYGVESQIAAAHRSSQEDEYTYQGIRVYRYPVFPDPREEPNHGHIPHSGFKYFASWLKKQKADIYHQHQWEPKCGLPHLRLAKQLGMKTVVSIRLPECLCQRKTLMLYGETACDGKIDLVRCSRCCDILSRKIPELAIKALGHAPLGVLSRAPMPASVYARVPVSGTMGSFVRPLAIPALIKARQQGLQEMVKFADRIVTLSQTLHDMLLANGVPQEKLTICRTGIPSAFPILGSKTKSQTGPLKVVFLGRWSRTKGIHLLVAALKSLPVEMPIQLTIYGIQDDKRYRQEVLSMIGDDKRIQISDPLSREELPSTLKTYDVLALPSQWFDVRPMAVLEAHALGLPVIGSNMGGIPELINHEVDGLLVAPTDVSAWSNALARLVLEPNLLQSLREGIQPIRTMRMEAEETVKIYQSL